MCAIEQEVGLCVVVKQPVFPTDRVMAARTVAVEATLMRILLKMAVHASLGRISKYMGVVAAITIGGSMRAKQRKLRQVVIEKDIVLPGCFVVAVIADNALFAFMSIIFLMAGVAVRLQFNFEYRRDVAGFTFDGFVRTV